MPLRNVVASCPVMPKRLRAFFKYGAAILSCYRVTAIVCAAEEISRGLRLIAPYLNRRPVRPRRRRGG